MKILVVGDPHGDIKKIKRIPIKWIDLILITGDIGKADLARQRAFENVNRKKEGLSELEENKKFKKEVYNEIYNSFLEVLKNLSKFAPTYSILGNVGGDMLKNAEVKKDEKDFKIKLPYLSKGINKLHNFYIVKNVVRNINGLRVGFLEYFADTNWVQNFKPADYSKRISKARKETIKAKRILSNFKNLDILICHQPPYGYLDKVDNPSAPKGWNGKHAGSKVV